MHSPFQREQTARTIATLAAHAPALRCHEAIHASEQAAIEDDNDPLWNPEGWLRIEGRRSGASSPTLSRPGAAR